MSKRLTYRSNCGDYGCAVDYGSDDNARWREIYALRNKLGEYEDNDEWRSVDRYGNPKEAGEYVVTVENPISHIRRVDVSIFKVSKGYFNIEVQGVRVVAWKPFVHKPYMGVADENKD